MINSVRNTVLSVLNKNNYGYISPSDFNLYAKNAQMELYEEYFSNYNKTINMENVRQVGTDYAEIIKTLAEVLDTFMVYDYLHPVYSLFPVGIFTNKFNLPNASQNIAGESYMINKIMVFEQIVYGTCDSASGLSFATLVDTTQNFLTAGVSPGDTVVDITNNASTTVISIGTTTNPNDTLLLVDSIFNINDKYAIYSSVPSEAERVTNGKIDMLNASLLTAPSRKYPAYIQTSDTITVYPLFTPSNAPFLGMVKAAYFRYPKDPKWTYISLSGGEPVFNSSATDYQDFELPAEDEYKLTMKILQYCGVSIREAQVVQFAMAQEQHEQPTFSMQQ